MKYNFFNLDNELKSIQAETQYCKQKLKVDKVIDNIIYLKQDNINSIIIDTSEYLISKDFYNDNISSIKEGFEIFINSDYMSKEEAIDNFIEQLEIYYLIFKLPNFNISIKRLEYFLSTFYDYVKNNNKGDFLKLACQINRLVLANSLIHNKEIKYIDYINMLKYLIFFGFNDKEIKKLSNILNHKKITNFEKYIQKKI